MTAHKIALFNLYYLAAVTIATRYLLDQQHRLDMMMWRADIASPLMATEHFRCAALYAGAKRLAAYWQMRPRRNVDYTYNWGDFPLYWEVWMQLPYRIRREFFVGVSHGAL